MSRLKLNGLSKQELIELKKQLEEEIASLKKIIEVSNTLVFDLLIKEVKKEMQENIAQEEWKRLRENQKKIESYHNIEKILQNQEELLKQKETEFEDVENALKYYQISLFEQAQENQEVENTGFKDKQQLEIKTGDVYKSNQPNVTNGYYYYLIKKSSEKEGSFAIISNYFEDERLLQYPKNLELLHFAHYEGNIYIQDEEQEYALEGLKKIADSQEISEEEK